MFKQLLPFVISVFASYTFAQDFEVSPVILNFSVNPGEIQQATVTIRNHANIKQGYTFVFGDFEVDSEGNKTRMPAGTSSRSCANWITVSPSFIELNPNEEQQITVIMTVPEDGSSTRWGMIYVQAAEEQNENPVDKQLTTGIKVVPRIVIQVNQSPKINTNFKASIADLIEVTTPNDSLRVFSVTVTNTGDKIIEASVGLMLAELETAIQQKFPVTMQRVFPGESRKFTMYLPANSGTGRHVLAAILDYGHGTNLEGTQLILDL